ncbi:MAG: hypothetical protein HYV17_14950 [Xanthomonadales bacterium]|nr:hypothetical protein [Xanthomonadales bacterium]
METISKFGTMQLNDVLVISAGLLALMGVIRSFTPEKGPSTEARGARDRWAGFLFAVLVLVLAFTLDPAPREPHYLIGFAVIFFAASALDFKSVLQVDSIGRTIAIAAFAVFAFAAGAAARWDKPQFASDRVELHSISLPESQTGIVQSLHFRDRNGDAVLINWDVEPSSRMVMRRNQKLDWYGDQRVDALTEACWACKPSDQPAKVSFSARLLDAQNNESDTLRYTFECPAVGVASKYKRANPEDFNLSTCGGAALKHEESEPEGTEQSDPAVVGEADSEAQP